MEIIDEKALKLVEDIHTLLVNADVDLIIASKICTCLSMDILDQFEPEDRNEIIEKIVKCIELKKETIK